VDTGEGGADTASMVFVVDDDGDVRSGLARLLRAHGMQVATFASAREFLRCPRPDGPACLILDVRLAGEDGLRVQEALRTAAWRPPIIFITGYGTVPQCVRALKGGAIDFLQKPVDDEALLAAIATALEQDARTRDRQRQHAALQQRGATLTPREQEVMGLLTAGLLNKEIASRLGISEKTIKAHRANIKRKMQAGSVAELVRMVALLETGCAAAGSAPAQHLRGLTGSHAPVRPAVSLAHDRIAAPVSAAY
jgi:FixJ family two-component response regulator